MKTNLWKLLWVATIAAVVVVAPATFAQTDQDAGDAAEEGDVTVTEEIIVVGTRSDEPRSVIDSPVPVDVITAEEFVAIGNDADLTDNLRTLVPSYTATPATGDGSAFVRPTSLRGTAPDQTLVLVNGKRRHRTALVHIFAPAAGNGAHGVDVGMIPGIAIKRVEVLRDGAAAQYGSDAIAGVINFEMKDASDGSEVQLQWGEHYDGENSLRASYNGGYGFGNNGFFNLSAEYVDNDALSRGVQRPDAQALIDAGVPGVGADAPFGDTPLVQTWGRPQTEGIRLFLNMGTLVGDNSQWYLHGNFAETEGRYRFFYRPPDHSSLVPLRAMGFEGLVAGFTPFLDGDQTDLSTVTGVTGVFGGGTTYDFSIGYGSNELDYLLNNTINPAVGLDASGNPAQMDYDVGALEQEEINLNADFHRTLSDNVGLGFGAEWREETFSLIAGEPNSYLGPGSSGFRGFSPNDSGSFARDNFAVYADLEHDISDAFLMQYALRYEDFSDFGDTLNGKIATRYFVNPSFSLRAAVSTGFHAPTPGQRNYRQVITTFDGTTGMQVEEGLVPADSPLVEAVGGKPLVEETSLNYSAGFTSNRGRTSFTVDAYQIQVDDRIYRTGDIPVPTLPGQVERSISFYTNALDVESQGIDVVVNSTFEWGSSDVSTAWFLAFNYNEIDVVNQKQINGVNPVNDGLVEDIENNYPNDRFVLNTITNLNEQLSWLLRANYYGKHYDERGRIGADVDPSHEIGSTLFFDTEFNYDFNDTVGIAIGAINVFDEFIDEIGPPEANRLSVGLQYPRRTAANYEGGSWYIRGRFRF